MGVISFMNQDYAPQRWHQFLIYIGYNLVAFLLNAFGNSLLPYVTKGAFAWSITGFVIISITVLACSSPNYASGKFVFTEFINGKQSVVRFFPSLSEVLSLSKFSRGSNLVVLPMCLECQSLY